MNDTENRESREEAIVYIQNSQTTYYCSTSLEIQDAIDYSLDSAKDDKSFEFFLRQLSNEKKTSRDF